MISPLLKNGARLLAAIISATGFAADTGVKTPSVEDSLFGMQTSLTTSGYKFFIGDEPSAPLLDPPKPPATKFVACAALYNRSSTSIPFTFANAGLADRKFTFRIFNTEGQKVWESDADLVDAQVITSATLEKRSRWKRVLSIPLKDLTPGIYTLESSIDADKQIGATSIFEIALRAKPPEPGKDTGIKGFVLRATGNPPGAANILPDEVPAAGAMVRVTEFRAENSGVARQPFVWSGVADADGQFNVVTPVGRFRVTAVVPAVQTDAGLVSSVERSLEVNVVAGKISEVTFHLPVPVVTLPPSGIKGLVLFGPISPVTLEGQPNEAPAANATVVVEQIVSTATVTGAVQFRWTGITGKEGRFEVRTPVGRFRVTSTLPSNPTTVVGATATIRPPSATVEVTAESGKVSETTLHIDTGLR